MRRSKGAEAGTPESGRDPKPVTRYQVEWLTERLMEAERLLRRGVKALNRPSWRLGETDDEWKHAVEKHLTGRKMEDDYERAGGTKA